MKASHLYSLLYRDFILPRCSDDWSRIAFNDFYTQQYQRSFMGLMFDNAEEIKHVYTAAFPSPAVLQRLYDMDVTDSLLFVHHPMTWDITRAPAFVPISLADLAELQSGRIAVYNLHIPLDRTSDFSTSVTLARALQGTMLESFNVEHGCEVSVTALVPYDTVHELHTVLDSLLGHESRLYVYGRDEIRGKMEKLRERTTAKHGAYAFREGFNQLRENAFKEVIASAASIDYAIENEYDANFERDLIHICHKITLT